MQGILFDPNNKTYKHISDCKDVCSILKTTEFFCCRVFHHFVVLFSINKPNEKGISLFNSHFFGKCLVVSTRTNLACPLKIFAPISTRDIAFVTEHAGWISKVTTRAVMLPFVFVTFRLPNFLLFLFQSLNQLNNVPFPNCKRGVNSDWT